MLENKNIWMSDSAKKKEKDIIKILEDKETNCTDKAKLLGYKKQTVYLDGVRKLGWVNGESLSFSVKKIVESHLKMPLGFDYYYWGDQIFKDEKIKELKEGRISLQEFQDLYPNACQTCYGDRWDSENGMTCLDCNHS